MDCIEALGLCLDLHWGLVRICILASFCPALGPFYTFIGALFGSALVRLSGLHWGLNLAFIRTLLGRVLVPFSGQH